MDNLPPALLANFAELSLNYKKEINKVAAVVDIRGGIFFDDFFKGIEELDEKGFKAKILYLDSDDDILIKRYKELRRPHPLSSHGTLSEGIKKERKLLEEVKGKSDYIINTSRLTIGMLKEEIYNIFEGGERERQISISVVSFGFKHGILLDGDLIFDVRFIPNPYYIEGLRELSGKDQGVKDYVFQQEEARTFVDKIIDMLEYLIPYYIKECKTQLIIGIGCTGGRHRSVALTEEIRNRLGDDGYRALSEHRDCHMY